ncbi:basic leucine zipper 61-like isoform X2 [Corylus avellana]|uniref:basic leucine zipper 61-like isoform X2 n=1 Tax=Corylus avellana TaxID=13451 RepID=UPI00286C5CFF|nr:basic leucine zipper 61-like isoform X2 [Corylus avellana]
MAQLPPKIPNMTPNWHDFSHQKISSIGSTTPNLITKTTVAASTATSSPNPSWVDEFLDFSSARRGSHRRTVSDSITFLEAPILVDECRGSGAPPGSGTASNEFDRFDDEQFLSMFTDEMSTAVAPTVSSSNPSTPSDHNSINDDEKETTPPHDHHHHHYQPKQQLKNESEEVESQCQSDTQTLQNAVANMSNDRITDPKRVKRILANRQSAQRSRAEVSVLSPRVAFLDHQRLLLNVDNSALKQRIAALAQDKIFKDAHQEALKREIERLRQVYHQQNLKKMENVAPISSQPHSDHANTCNDKEQLLNV